MILLLWSLERQEFITIYISDIPEVRSMERLYLRLRQNLHMFKYFITLTFTDTREGYYPIENRYLESKLKVWTKKDKYYKFINKKTLMYIHNNYTLTGYMRKFINVCKTYMRKYNLGTFTYCWKYERGSKTERPHFHMLTSDFGTKNITKHFWESLEKRWGSGYVDIEPIDNEKKALNYLYKYVKKTNIVEKDAYNPRGKRRWAVSRDIPKKESNPNYIYYDCFLDSEADTMLWIIDNLFYDYLKGIWETKP